MVVNEMEILMLMVILKYIYLITILLHLRFFYIAFFY